MPVVVAPSTSAVMASRITQSDLRSAHVLLEISDNTAWADAIALVSQKQLIRRLFWSRDDRDNYCRNNGGLSR
jgi:hypothetical protein